MAPSAVLGVSRRFGAAVTKAESDIIITNGAAILGLTFGVYALNLDRILGSCSSRWLILASTQPFARH